MAHEISPSIRDNQGRGKVGDFLEDKIQNSSKLSIVSAYFTIYAYEQLKEKLQRIYDFPPGSIWDFFLDVLGVKKIPTNEERIEMGFESYISMYNFTPEQVEVLRKIKNVFAANISSHGKIDIDSIFANPIYSRLIGQFDEINQKFEGQLKVVVAEMERSFRFAA